MISYLIGVKYQKKFDAGLKQKKSIATVNGNTVRYNPSRSCTDSP